MPAPEVTTPPAKTRAKEVAKSGTAVRDRVRALTLAAFRDRALSLSDVPKLVREVLEGAAEGLDASIPSSRRNVLREVFDGLSDGVQSIASAGSALSRDVGERGKTIAGPTAHVARRRLRAANQEFLGAVKGFATKASKQVREGLHEFIAEAKRAGPKVAASARRSAKAADGRLIELTDETARAGLRVARRAAGALAMGTGGFLEGLAEVITPKERRMQAKKPMRARAKPATRKAKPKPQSETGEPAD